MKVMFKLAQNDETHLNKHIHGSGIMIRVDRRAHRPLLGYTVEGEASRVERFMSKIDWLKLEDLQSGEEKSVDLGLNALSEALEVLDLSVTKLRKALSTGDYDLYLEALLEAEQAGKTRKTAFEALQDRIGES